MTKSFSFQLRLVSGVESYPRLAAMRLHNFAAFNKAALLFLIGGAMVLSSLVLAQGQFGSITGSAQDPSGAGVPGATVTVKNNGTGATQTTTTNDQGEFTVVNLPPASYSVTVAHPGFQSATQSQVDVTIGGSTRVDMKLLLGQASTVVEVTAPVPDIQTDSSTLGGTVEGQQVVESPLNGRNVNNLLDFVPGVIPGGGTQGSTMANGGSGSVPIFV